MNILTISVKVTDNILSFTNTSSTEFGRGLHNDTVERFMDQVHGLVLDPEVLMDIIIDDAARRSRGNGGAAYKTLVTKALSRVFIPGYPDKTDIMVELV